MLFLDTCILRYWICEPEKLGRHVYKMLVDDYVPVCISMETIRELIVDWNNSRKGGNELRKKWRTKQEMIDDIVNGYKVKILPVDMNVMETYAKLEPIPEHKDPSDHIIIAHAITTGFTLVSSDKNFAKYVIYKLDLFPNQ